MSSPSTTSVGKPQPTCSKTAQIGPTLPPKPLPEKTSSSRASPCRHTSTQLALAMMASPTESMKAPSSSTAHPNSLDMVQSLHQRYADQGITFLDAPVSGGVVGAQERDLAVYVGGDRDTYDSIKPTLDAMGDKVQYCGGIGTGTICKLMNQLFGSIVGMARMEVITAGVKAGVDFDVLVKAIHEGSGGKRRPFEGFERPPENYDDTELTFYLELMAKDVRLANETARSVQVPLPLGNLTEARMIEGLNRGWGKKRGEIIGEIQQQISNVDLKVDG